MTAITTMVYCTPLPKSHFNYLSRRTKRSSSTTSILMASTSTFSAATSAAYYYYYCLLTLFLLLFTTTYISAFSVSAFGGTSNIGSTHNQHHYWSLCNAKYQLLSNRHHHQHHFHHHRGRRQHQLLRLRNTLVDNHGDHDDDYADKYDPDVVAQLRKARQLLDDVAKKNMMKEASTRVVEEKVATTIATSSSSPIPFFAGRTTTTTTATSPSSTTSTNKIKSKTQSGSIIADGESMALLSKSEPWEIRSLSQLKFQKEATLDYYGNTDAADDDDDDDNDDDGSKSSSSSLADRDVASSIYNLRKLLQTEDFMKVFDSRNRFIGDLD